MCNCIFEVIHYISFCCLDYPNLLLFLWPQYYFILYLCKCIYISLFFFNLSHVNGAEWNKSCLVLSCLNKPMVITEPRCTKLLVIALGSKLYPSNIQHMRNKDLTPFMLDLFLSMPKLSKWKESSASRVIFWQLLFQISNRRFTDDFDSISCYTVCKH